MGVHGTLAPSHVKAHADMVVNVQMPVAKLQQAPVNTESGGQFMGVHCTQAPSQVNGQAACVVMLQLPVKNSQHPPQGGSESEGHGFIGIHVMPSSQLGVGQSAWVVTVQVPAQLQHAPVPRVSRSTEPDPHPESVAADVVHVARQPAG